MTRVAHRPTAGLVATVCLLMACGGGDSGSPNPPPPPPPPPPGPPATVSIQQGDNQQGEPGKALATRPAVLVRDASSRPVPNVTVSFAIDSGGGAIASANTSTDATGVATAGDWTLGAAEGRNILLVTAGGLPTLRISANARLPEIVLGDGSLSQGGGKITINKPGSSLDGLELTVPANAFTSSVSVTVRQRSSFGLVLPIPGAPAASAAATSSGRAAEINLPITPVITIVSTGPAKADGSLELSIPVPAEIGNPVVAVIDDQGAVVAHLPIVERDATTITVTTMVLDPALFAAIGNIQGNNPAPPHVLSIVVFDGSTGTGPQNISLWARYPFTMPYTFGQSDLRFNPFGTTASDRIDIGMMLAELGGLHYYPNGIHARGERAPGISYSDTWGFMLSSGLNIDAAQDMVHLPQAVTYWKNCCADYDYHMAVAIIGVMWKNQRAVPVWLTNGTRLMMVLAYGWDPAGERFVVRDPNYPTPQYLRFRNGDMLPYQDAVHPNVQYNTLYFTFDWLAAAWERLKAPILAGQPASDQEPFTSLFRASATGSRGSVGLRPTPSAPDSVFFLADTTRIWPMTQGATYFVPGNVPVPDGWRQQNASLFERDEAGTWNSQATGFARSWLYDWTAHTAGHAETVGMVIAEDHSPGAIAWAGWREVRLIKYGLKLEADFKEIGTPSTFTPTLLSGSPALPSGAKFEWDFGDDTPKEVTSTLGPVTHTYDEPGTYEVVLEVIHPSRDIPIARVKKGGESQPAPYWALTSIADQDELLEKGTPGESGEIYDLLVRVTGTPGAGLIAVDPTATGSELSLRVLKAGTWSGTNCCPPADGVSEWRQLLGVKPRETVAVGPFFAGWNVSDWSQSGTDLDSGTMTSSYVMAVRTYAVEDGGTQAGPAGVIKLNGTRNGKTMSGTIVIWIWWIDGDTGEVSEPPQPFRFPFSATRIH